MKQSIELRSIKGSLFDKLKSQGFNVNMTDTPSLVFFTNKPVNHKSVKYESWFITSFGKVGALKYLNI